MNYVINPNKDRSQIRQELIQYVIRNFHGTIAMSVAFALDIGGADADELRRGTACAAHVLDRLDYFDSSLDEFVDALDSISRNGSKWVADELRQIICVQRDPEWVKPDHSNTERMKAVRSAMKEVFRKYMTSQVARKMMTTCDVKPATMDVFSRDGAYAFAYFAHIKMFESKENIEALRDVISILEDDVNYKWDDTFCRFVKEYDIVAKYTV